MIVSPHRFEACRDKRKRLGIFYTPEWIARILVRWALEAGPGSVLDPSFGGCAFLSAARDTLIEMGANEPYRLIFGFDVDRRTYKHVAPLLDWGIPRDNIVFGDFLSEPPLTRFSAFDAVVGNPPYVRHHTMSDATIDRAQELVAAAGAALPRTSGAWAYFAILSTAYVREGGRLALILPGAALQSHYGQSALSYIEDRFGSLRVLHVHDRLFDETNEESVIILASDRGDRCKARYQRVRSAASLALAVYSDAGDEIVANLSSYKMALVGNDALSAWHDLTSNSKMHRLRDLASIRIGVVTGANDFFLRSVEDPILQSRDVRSIPVIASKRWLSGPAFNQSDLRNLLRLGFRARLAIIRGAGRPGSRLRKEICEAEKTGISVGFHCGKREPWYLIRDVEAPNLFLPYMSGGEPYMVRNDAGATCTNAVHRVTLKGGNLRSASSIVVSSLSTLFAFEAELRGRHYGGGVLKLEPGAAGLMHVIRAGISEQFETLSRRKGFDQSSACDYVDEQLLHKMLGLSKAGLRALRCGVNALSRERNQKRENSQQDYESDDNAV